MRRTRLAATQGNLDADGAFHAAREETAEWTNRGSQLASKFSAVQNEMNALTAAIDTACSWNSDSFTAPTNWGATAISD